MRKRTQTNSSHAYIYKVHLRSPAGILLRDFYYETKKCVPTGNDREIAVAGAEKRSIVKAFYVLPHCNLPGAAREPKPIATSVSERS